MSLISLPLDFGGWGFLGTPRCAASEPASVGGLRQSVKWRSSLGLVSAADSLIGLATSGWAVATAEPAAAATSLLAIVATADARHAVDWWVSLSLFVMNAARQDGCHPHQAVPGSPLIQAARHAANPGCGPVNKDDQLCFICQVSNQSMNQKSRDCANTTRAPNKMRLKQKN